jgi:hypothetical protein
VTVRGPAWPWPGPAQILDAVLTDPRVDDAVAKTTSGWVTESEIESVLKRHAGLVLPSGADPDTLLVLKLWLTPARGGGSFPDPRRRGRPGDRAGHRRATQLTAPRAACLTRHPSTAAQHPRGEVPGRHRRSPVRSSRRML